MGSLEEAFTADRTQVDVDKQNGASTDDTDSISSQSAYKLFEFMSERSLSQLLGR